MTTEQRTPRRGDPIVVYGDRRTILEVRDGRALTDDAAGFRMTRRTDLLWWDGAAWRGWAGR